MALSKKSTFSSSAAAILLSSVVLVLLPTNCASFKINLVKTSAKISQLTGQFWHVTDFHWDLNYTEYGSDSSAMCWYSNDSDSSVSVGHFGNYACDSPWTLVQSTLDFMKATLPDPDFIIWTGDDSSHVSDDNFSEDKVIEIMGNVTNAILAHFPNTPVVPVFGNHDAFPKHNFSPKTSDLYVRVGDLWKNWLKEGYTSFQKGGFYTVDHPILRDVKFIGLNTPLYYQKNPLVTDNMTDPGGQFLFLEQVLADAYINKQKVYIVAHVPPGMFGRKETPTGYPWFRPKFNRRYLDIVVKYADTIIGQFFGHDHTDSLKLYYDAQGTGTPVNVHFAAPAVTPWNTTLSGIGPNNPGVRLFTYNTNSGNLINYEQFFLNLTEANINNQDGWRLEYDFLRDYQLEDMSYQSINRMVQTFTTNDRTFFNKYYTYNSVSASDAVECDATCERNSYCAIVKVDYDEFATCNGAQSSGSQGKLSAAPLVVVIAISLTWVYGWRD